jgi:hypothetical protein
MIPAGSYTGRVFHKGNPAEQLTVTVGPCGFMELAGPRWRGCGMTFGDTLTYIGSAVLLVETGSAAHFMQLEESTEVYWLFAGYAICFNQDGDYNVTHDLEWKIFKH